MNKPSPPEPRFYRSPVDYEAWREGYLPPTEHILIHELSTGQAKIVMRSSTGGDRAFAIISINGALTMDADDCLEMMQFFVERKRKWIARNPYPPKMVEGDLAGEPTGSTER